MVEFLIASYVMGALLCLRPIFRKLASWAALVQYSLRREEVIYCSLLALLIVSIWPLVALYKFISWWLRRGDTRQSPGGGYAGIWGGTAASSGNDQAKIRRLEQELVQAREYSARLEIELDLRAGAREIAIQGTDAVA
jgi:hypothetical protein